MQHQIKQNPSKKVYKAWGTSTPAALSSADPPRCYCRRVRLRWHTDDQSWIPTLATSWHHFRLPLFDIFCETDSKMFLLEHLRYSFKPMCVAVFSLWAKKGLDLSSAKAETPRFYHIGMSEEQISHSHQERLSQGQILHCLASAGKTKFTVHWADWYEWKGSCHSLMQDVYYLQILSSIYIYISHPKI